MMNYFKHLYDNWRVAFKAILSFIFHFIHGIIPIKYTSHEYWKINLNKGNKGNS